MLTFIFKSSILFLIEVEKVSIYKLEDNMKSVIVKNILTSQEQEQVVTCDSAFEQQEQECHEEVTA